MPPLLLEDDEAVAVAIGLRTATNGSLAGIEETSLRALAKLEQVLPPRLRRQVSTLLEVTVHVARRRPGSTVDPSMLAELARLARAHFTVRFDYSDRRDQASQRRVEPYRIVNAGQRWYLVAWDLDRADWRTFRVDRMRPNPSPGARFRPRPLTDAEVEALIARGVPPEARRHQARILVHCPAAELAARVGPWVGRITAVDDKTCILETGADNLETFAGYLAFLGADFSVSETPELAEHVRRLAARFAAAAS